MTIIGTRRALVFTASVKAAEMTAEIFNRHRPKMAAWVCGQTDREERRRVLPVVRDLKRRRPDAVVSIDTYKASVARAAVEFGAEVVNDVSGFRWDPKMAKTLAELKVGAVLMHTRGRPEEWRSSSFPNVAMISPLGRPRSTSPPGFVSLPPPGRLFGSSITLPSRDCARLQCAAVAVECAIVIESGATCPLA